MDSCTWTCEVIITCGRALTWSDTLLILFTTIMMTHNTMQDTHGQLDLRHEPDIKKIF